VVRAHGGLSNAWLESEVRRSRRPASSTIRVLPPSLDSVLAIARPTPTTRGLTMFDTLPTQRLSLTSLNKDTRRHRSQWILQSLDLMDADREKFPKTPFLRVLVRCESAPTGSSSRCSVHLTSEPLFQSQ
jgi:hypothetical protein